MMQLVERAPSSNWESVFLDPQSTVGVWVWFRPPTIPTGLMIVIPIASFGPSPNLMTIRRIILATGLDPANILGWSFSGLTFDTASAAAGLIDQPIPSPVSGDLSVTIWMELSAQSIGLPQYQSAPWPVQGMPPQGQIAAGVRYESVPAVTGNADVYRTLIDEIDACWNSVIQLEVKLGSVRSQLEQSASRLNILNRDLSMEERRQCDNKDKQDWLEARRWMREAALNLNRSIKEIDLGTTSGAGRRNRFEEIYRKQIVPRIPFAGIEQAINEYESHRKSVQNVLASAQSTLAKAGRDAEQRANSVLQRITSRSRSTRK